MFKLRVAVNRGCRPNPRDRFRCRATGWSIPIFRSAGRCAKLAKMTRLKFPNKH